MDEISNKTLAILLIGAIVISLGGTLISLNRLARIRIPGITGFYGAAEEAEVRLDIESNVQVNFTTDTINWGTGYVVSPNDFCVLNSYDGTIGANCTGFTPQTAGFILENVGNRNVTLNVSMQYNAVDFIGIGAVCKWNVSESESGSAPGLELTPGDWQTCVTTGTVVCNSTGNGFLSAESSDTLHFDVLVEIPSAEYGVKTNVMTASAALV